MQDRNQMLNQRFVERVMAQQFPQDDIGISLTDAGVSAADLVQLFRSQVQSRHLDLRSRLMQKLGQSFYTIGSSGHEGNAACAMALRPTDMAFLHYRSGAFVIERSNQVSGQTPLYDMLLSFAASSEDPVSGGRHKVLGSKALNIPPQTSTIASHLPKAVGTAFSVPLSKRLDIDAPLPKDSIVMCNFGDASANHSTAQGAINAAAWASFQSIPVPIVFICEDNGIGISTSTPKGWIEANFSQRAGLTYLRCDGLSVLDTLRQTREAARIAREQRKPVFLHMRTVRLLGHAGSDAEFVYRDQACIDATEAQDPLLHTARILVENQILSPAQVVALYEQTEQTIARIAAEAGQRPRLDNVPDIKKSLDPEPLADEQANRFTLALSQEQRANLFRHEKHNLPKKQHMAKLINWALLDLMAENQNMVMCGEDIGKKGGVYNVTSKLYDKFGGNRVINTLLDEQSILGLAIGLAHNGFLPVPEIQFLAYVHNAEDQIRGEAATLPYFSNGQFTNPMVIRIAGLAYQKGFGGHFHNDNSLAVFRDIPGVIIACPSNGADAVEMMRACVETAKREQKVVIFIEPIALYMKKDLHEEGDNLWSFDYVAPDKSQPIQPGEITSHGDGKDLCVLSYGNGYYLSRQAQEKLAQEDIHAKTVDLRWLAPLNETAILQQVQGYKKVIIVDECRKTGSVSEALVTLLSEGLPQMPTIERITAEDCFIPLGSASYELLPDCEQIVQTAKAMMDHTSQLEAC